MRPIAGLAVVALGLMVLGACTTQPAPSRTWTVQRGESLGGIATRHGVTVADLRAANGIEGNLIHPGDVLTIPGAGTASAPARSQARGDAPRRAGKRAAKSGSPSPDPGLPSHADWPAPPRPEPCLAAPDGADLGDQGAVASAGLSQSDARRALSAVMAHTASCVTTSPPAGTLMVELTVGCDGVVSAARVVDDPGWPEDVRSCVVSLLRRADFPAHDLPDGETIVQPVGWGG